MLLIIAIILLLGLVFGPHLWCKRVLNQYSEPIPELPGNGSELARHLLKRLNIDAVKVEEGQDDQNQYEPDNKIVRLAPDVFHKKSLTAITIAAHEVGHAMQDHANYPPLKLRSRLYRFIFIAEKLAAGLLISVPFIALLTKLPHLSVITFFSGICILGLPIVLHMITLPVEFDASFRRALPILEQGNYLPETAMPYARKILTAAALTYVAASLVSLLNFYRWIAILRR